MEGGSSALLFGAMKNLLTGMMLLTFCAFASVNVVAQQCDRSNLSPIRCGYYEEAYQDGANDARNGLENNHRRYRSKYENQYESFYRSGYDDGYASVRPFARWTDRQKNTYEQGYDDGRDDKRRDISRLPARYEGQYDRQEEAYYRRGYLDGYDGKQKTFDVPLDARGRVIVNGNVDRPVDRDNRRFPGRRRGTSTGTASWSGRVDNRVNIVLKRGQIRTQTVAGDISNVSEQINGVLPRREATVSVRKLDGRGTARVIQQPSRLNDFTAIVQIFDQRRGRDNYNISISWEATSKIEEYSSGRVTWRGRVDSEAEVRISGDQLESIDLNSTGLSGVISDFQGYLAARPGIVRLNKRDGRGRVWIKEQPSEANDFTVVIGISDDRGGSDTYAFDVTW